MTQIYRTTELPVDPKVTILGLPIHNQKPIGLIFYSKIGHSLEPDHQGADIAVYIVPAHHSPPVKR